MFFSLSPSADKLPTGIPTIEEIEQGTSLWQDAWHRLAKNKLAIFGGSALIVLAIACVVGPWLSPYGYEENNLNNTFSPPSWAHWLGTDQLGRDLLVRLLVGGRISIGVGLCATFVALTIGVVYGAVAGFSEGKLNPKVSAGFCATLAGVLYFLITLFTLGSFSSVYESLVTVFTAFFRLSQFQVIIGGASFGFVGAIILNYLGVKLDSLMMRIVDIMYALPFTIFVILLMVFFGRDIWLLFLAIGAVEWLTMSRIVRGQIISLKKMEFVEAARSLGLSNTRILFRHMIPNILGPIIVYTTLTIPAVMLLEAFLSFLGLGVQPPLSSWGVLIKDGAEKMEEYPWLLMFPGVVFSLTLFSLNFLGDGLRDALDVRSSKD